MVWKMRLTSKAGKLRRFSPLNDDFRLEMMRPGSANQPGLFSDSETSLASSASAASCPENCGGGVDLPPGPFGAFVPGRAEDLGGGGCGGTTVSVFELAADTEPTFANPMLIQLPSLAPTLSDPENPYLESQSLFEGFEAKKPSDSAYLFAIRTPICSGEQRTCAVIL